METIYVIYMKYHSDLINMSLKYLNDKILIYINIIL